MAQGWFNVVNGVWPLVSMRSFEAVTGPKVDKWLVRTVAGLLLGNGVAMIVSSGSSERLRSARLIGLATAASLGAVDLTYAPRGRISRFYLVDAVVETAWLLAWWGSPDQRR